jgi:non-specific protein-tyrosine kinase
MVRVIATLEQQIEALSEQVRSLQAIADPGSQGQIDGLVRLRAEQQQQLAYARALVASAEGLLSVLQPSDSTVKQIAPRPLQYAALAALLAVVVAYALLLLRVALNTRLRSSDDVAAVSGLPVLAEIPTASRNDESRVREASSYLRTNLLFATEGVHPRAFMVTSTVEHEGKTTVARHLAESFVRSGYSTLLVDADLRDPSVIDAYELLGGQDASTTTASWLSDPSGPHQVLSVELGEGGHLDVIPQFDPIANAPELLGRGFRLALASWQDYDVIVVDTPPVLAVADPLTIAPHCSGTILVVDRKRSDRRKLVGAIGALHRIGVQLLGVVANNVGPTGSGGAGYGATQGTRSPHAPGQRVASVPAANAQPGLRGSKRD